MHTYIDEYILKYMRTFKTRVEYLSVAGIELESSSVNAMQYNVLTLC